MKATFSPARAATTEAPAQVTLILTPDEAGKLLALIGEVARIENLSYVRSGLYALRKDGSIPSYGVVNESEIPPICFQKND